MEEEDDSLLTQLELEVNILASGLEECLHLEKEERIPFLIAWKGWRTATVQESDLVKDPGVQVARVLGSEIFFVRAVGENVHIFLSRSCATD